MEMNLAPFYGTIFDLMIFAFVATPSIAILIAIWLDRRFVKKQPLGVREAFQIWSRVALDSVMVMGICGTTIGMQGMVANMDLDTTTTENLYSTVRIALLTFIWAGLLAGLGLAIRDKQSQVDFKLSIAGLTFVLFCLFYLIFDQIDQTGVPPKIFFTEPFTWTIYGGIFVACFLTALACGKSKSLLIIAIESNLAATLGGAGIGMCYWFLEGGNYLESRDAIFITANIITIGCISYLLLYFLSLYCDKRELGDFQIKTWHFTEAASFFIFLIYAPVSSTEYFRESIDQAGIQAQHEAQEIRIEQLEAQIRLLTENQKS